MSDLRFALRQLRKSPGLTAVVLLSLAVGIGANAVVFTWIRATLLNSIPMAARPEELAVLLPQHRTHGLSDTMSLADIESLSAERKVFAGITGSQFGAVSVRFSNTQESEWLWGQSTTANFFDVLGVQPRVGRGFLPGEDLPGASSHVAVISHQLWQERFGGSTDVLGKVIEFNQRPVTIVGVAPSGFVGTMGGLRLNIWVPLATHFTEAELRPRHDSHGWRWLHTVARLAPGVNMRTANAAAQTISQRLAQEFPESSKDTVLRVLPVWKSTWGGQSLFLPLLRVLAVVAALLLLLVITNVSNLLLARAHARQSEISVRLALGAAPRRIVRQLLTESLLLAVIGGAAGVVLSMWGASTLTSLMPQTYLPVGYNLQLNWNVVALVALLTLCAGVFFGVAPAWRAARTNLNETLKAGGRALSGFGPRPWLRRAFVVGQVGLAFVLLLGMGLCVRSLRQAHQVDLGLEPRGLWVAGFKLSAHANDAAATRDFYQRLQTEAARLPGVQSVALADWLPLGFEGGSGIGVKVPGYQPTPGEDRSCSLSCVSPGYFETMQIPKLAGRDFTAADDAQAPLVGVVNEAFARKFFEGRDPVGLTINCWRGDVRIIGVVKTGKYRWLNEPTQSFVYLATAQIDQHTQTLIVRTEGSPRQVARAIEQLAVSLNPAAPPAAAMSYEDYVAAAFAIPNIAARLMSLLGVLALLLAVLGIYAVMSQNVAQRVRELGIRLALGAQPVDLRRMILKQGMLLAGLGLVLGGITAFRVSQLLSSLLVGVSARDTFTWICVPVLLMATALLTCWLPARRASRVDPMVALRTE